MTVSQSDRLKQLLMLKLSVGNRHCVMREVQRTGHRKDRRINVEAVLVRHILDLTPLIVGVEVGVTSPDHPGLVTFRLNIPVWPGSWQSGRSVGKLKVSMKLFLIDYFLLIP